MAKARSIGRAVGRSRGGVTLIRYGGDELMGLCLDIEPFGKTNEGIDVFLEFQSKQQQISRDQLEAGLESGARVMFGALENPALFPQLRAQHIVRHPEDADDFPQVLDPEQARASITMATSLKELQAQRQKIAAELRGEQRTIASEGRGEQRTISAEGRAEQRKIAGEERATTREFAKPGSPAPLRKEFTALSKDFRKVRDAFGKVQKAAENPSAAGDVSMIFGFMRMLDPASTVREGEFATAQNAAGIPDRCKPASKFDPRSASNFDPP